MGVSVAKGSGVGVGGYTTGVGVRSGARDLSNDRIGPPGRSFQVEMEFSSVETFRLPALSRHSLKFRARTFSYSNN